MRLVPRNDSRHFRDSFLHADNAKELDVSGSRMFVIRNIILELEYFVFEVLVRYRFAIYLGSYRTIMEIDVLA